MHRYARAMALSGLLCCTFAAVAASAEREAAGWAKWADFTSRVVEAGKTPPFGGAQVLSACEGATGVVIGQGFQFPYWAQNLTMACRTYKTFNDVDGKMRSGVDKGSKHGFFSGNLRKQLKREKKGLCRDAASVSKQLGKAEAVASEPRAQPLALELKAQMDMIMEKAECN